MSDDIGILVKALTVFGALVTPVVALLGWLIRRHLISIAEGVQRTEVHINHVEEDICEDGQKITLGQRVKRIDDKQDAMIVKQEADTLANDQAHARLWGALGKLPPDWLVARLAKLETACDTKQDKES